MSDPLNNLEYIWYHSQHLEVPYSPNQFLGRDFFCRFLQHTGFGFMIYKNPIDNLANFSEDSSLHSNIVNECDFLLRLLSTRSFHEIVCMKSEILTVAW